MDVNKIRVLLADDHKILRDGIRSLLAITSNIDVVGEASDGIEALEKVEETLPDVLVLDLSMPRMTGLDVTRRVCKTFPKTKVLVLTQYSNREYVIKVIEAGARGFLAKSSASSELINAIEAVYRGDSYLSPSAATVFIEEWQHIPHHANKGPLELLTHRETEVLNLVVEGHTTKDIAKMICVSPKTVEWHKRSLMKKLNIHKVTDLIKFAIANSMIQLQPLSSSTKMEHH
jgi:DNA-binding NarL/FixJ family response regulator